MNAGPWTPKVSVVLTAYNSERFIARAMQSMLDQTFRDLELIVVDDCSKDGTWQAIEQLAARDARIVPLRNERNLNLARSLNRGIAEARGRYIVRMDHDDESMPDRVEKQVAFLDAHSDVGIVGSAMQIMDENGTVIGVRRYNLTDESIRRHIFLYSPFCHPATALRKDVLDAAGGYDHAFNPAEDYELYFRLGLFAKFANLDEPLLRYRVVKGTSMTTAGTRRLEAATIAVRRKYSKVPQYRMRWIDRLYNACHYASLFVIPSRFKIWLFSRLRNV